MSYELVHAAKIALRVVMLKARCNNSGPSVGIWLWFCIYWSQFNVTAVVGSKVSYYVEMAVSKQIIYTTVLAKPLPNLIAPVDGVDCVYKMKVKTEFRLQY